MKKLCLILAISVLPTFGFTQFIGDTVIIYVDNRVEIKVAVADYIDLKTSDKIFSALEEFEKMIPEIEDQLSSASADLIKFSVGSSLTVEPGDPTFIYLIKDEELSNTGYRDQVIINGENFTVYITTSDILKITDLSLSSCLEKVIDLLPEKTMWSRSIYYECRNENIKKLETKSNSPDYLELQLGAGAGLVKNSLVTDISFGISLGLNHKGTIRAPYVSSNMVFDFGTESKININTFLNLGYQWEMNNKSEKRDFMGVELGYLISKQGDLFGENTFKFGINWSPAKLINVSPQLYITDNFKTIYPGIRIGFGL